MNQGKLNSSVARLQELSSDLLQMPQVLRLASPQLHGKRIQILSQKLGMKPQ